MVASEEPVCSIGVYMLTLFTGDMALSKSEFCTNVTKCRSP